MIGDLDEHTEMTDYNRMFNSIDWHTPIKLKPK